MGQNPLERELLYRRISRARRWVKLRSIGAVDIALWDIAGKTAGMPIHALIGTCRTTVPACTSSAILPSTEAYCEEAVSFRVSPFRAAARDANGTAPVTTSPNPPIMRRSLVLPRLERGTFGVAGGAGRGADREPPTVPASPRGSRRGSRDTTNPLPAGQDEPKEST